MTIRQETSFNFNGTDSSDFNIISVSVERGLYTEPFLARKNVIETKIRNREEPLFHRVERETLAFKLTLYFKGGWTDRENLRAVARWLDVDKYCPLYFGSEPERIFYVIFDDVSEIVHNGCKYGYITLNARTNSPYSFSELITSDEYDLSNNPATGTEIEIINNGDKDTYPHIYFQVITKGQVDIINQTTNETCTFTNDLGVNETIWVDCKNEQIVSNLPDIYRYDAHNNVFPKLAVGENEILVKGKVIILFKWQEMYLQ